MDPALIELVAEGAADDEVALVLRLADPALAPPGVRIVARFGDIATCRIARSDIARVHAIDNVVSLKAPHLYGPGLEQETPGLSGTVGGTASDADQSLDVLAATSLTPRASDLRRPADIDEAGRGVLLAHIDWGIDFAHPDFRHADGRTRLRAFWDQSAAYDPAFPNRYGYGRIYDAADIDRALGAADPYTALGYDSARTYPAGSGHGTHTLGISGGNGRSGGPVGLAPEAELGFVELSTQGEIAAAGLGDSAALLEALAFLAELAGELPLVVNASLGRQAGQHDGKTLTERGMDHFLLERPGRAIVQSTGNYFGRRIHADGVLRPGDARVLDVVIDPAPAVPHEVDLWYPGADRFDVVVQGPQGMAPVQARAGERTLLTHEAQVVGRVYHRLADPNNGDNEVALYLDAHAPAGDWAMSLLGRDVVDGRYHAWIERTKGGGARFAVDDDSAFSTTGTICNGLRTIAVGAYNAHRPERPLAPFSSGGPTRDGRDKPDLCAPGVRVLSARSHPAGRLPGGSFGLLTRMSGTSMAAPHVAGTVALMFEAAGRLLGIDETRRLLLAETGPPPTDADRLAGERLGCGFLDPAAAVRATRGRAAIPSPRAIGDAGGPTFRSVAMQAIPEHSDTEAESARESSADSARESEADCAPARETRGVAVARSRPAWADAIADAVVDAFEDAGYAGEDAEDAEDREDAGDQEAAKERPIDRRRRFAAQRRSRARSSALPFQVQLPIGGGSPSLAMPLGGSGSPFAFSVPLGGTPAPAAAPPAATPAATAAPAAAAAPAPAATAPEPAPEPAPAAVAVPAGTPPAAAAAPGATPAGADAPVAVALDTGFFVSPESSWNLAPHLWELSWDAEWDGEGTEAAEDDRDAAAECGCAHADGEYEAGERDDERGERIERSERDDGERLESASGETAEAVDPESCPVGEGVGYGDEAPAFAGPVWATIDEPAPPPALSPGQRFGLQVLRAAEAAEHDAERLGVTLRSTAALLQRLLSPSAAAFGSAGPAPSATALFNAFVHPGASALRGRSLLGRYARAFELLAAPGDDAGQLALQPGDLLLRIALGQGYGHVAVVASPRLCRDDELRTCGWRAESGGRTPSAPLPGRYVHVVEVLPWPRRREERYARRVGDAGGRVLADTLLLRPLPVEGAETDEAYADPEALYREDDPTPAPVAPPAPAPAAPDSALARSFIAAHSSRWCSPGQAGSATCRPIASPRPIRRVVVHTLAVPSTSRRSGVEAVVAGWQNPGRTASSHYLIDRDGTITQMVREADVAFHTPGNNADSIGIEHADVCNDPAPYTTALYEASAALVRDIAGRNGFVGGPATVAGHSQVNPNHGDPGPFWDWEYYFQLLGWAGASAPASRPLRFVVDTVGKARPHGWELQRRRAIANDRCASARDSWGATFWRAARGTGTLAELPLTVDTVGTYKVSLWWPSVANANAATPFVVIVNGPPGTTAGTSTQTVALDQRSRAGRWNDVATITVTHAPSQVRLCWRREAPRPGWIVADAGRLLKIATPAARAVPSAGGGAGVAETTPAPATPCLTLDRFGLDSAALVPGHTAQIDTAARRILAERVVAALITGFASSDGSDVHNLELGMRRAVAVMEALKARLEALRSGSSGRVALLPMSRGESDQISGGVDLNRRVTICFTATEPRPRPQQPVRSAVFRIVGKSFIAPIGSNTGSLSCGIDTPLGRIPGLSNPALRVFAAATDASFSEDPRDDTIFTAPPPESKGYRLFSRGRVQADCRGGELLSVSLSGSLTLDAGKECLPGLSVCLEPPIMVDQSFTTSRIDAGSIRFRWGVKGKPHPRAEPSFQAICTRTSVFIWHQIKGVISCRDGAPEVTTLIIEGSRFPSHRVWLDGSLKGSVRQGPMSNLWDADSSDSTRVR